MPALALNANSFFTSTFQNLGSVVSVGRPLEQRIEDSLKKNGETLLKSAKELLNNLRRADLTILQLEKELASVKSVIKLLEGITAFSNNIEDTSHPLVRFIVSKNKEILLVFKEISEVISEKIDLILSKSCTASSNESLSDIWNHSDDDVWDEIYKKGKWEK